MPYYWRSRDVVMRRRGGEQVGRVMMSASGGRRGGSFKWVGSGPAAYMQKSGNSWGRR